MEENNKMAVTSKGLKFIIAGLVVMVAGYILMMGGGSDDPQVFNYAMFNFQRTVAATLVIAAGVVVIVMGIMGWFPGKKKEEE